MATIGITGGTGFIGQHISSTLIAQGHKVIVFSRSPTRNGHMPQITYAFWDPQQEQIDTEALGRVQTMIHLAGAGIADKKLTPARKQEIIDSRVKGTHFLVSRLKKHAPGCRSLIATSAIGFYGPDRAHRRPFTEASAPFPDFLGETCQLWETAILSATDFQRVVILRTGIVLGKEGGAFRKLSAPLRWGIMPVLGSGRQIVSWIHVTDLASMFAYAVAQPDMAGIYNAVAPQPVTHRALMHAICNAKGGITIPIPVPAFLLRLAMGALAGEILKSCTVSAGKIKSEGFKFRFDNIREATQNLVRH